MPTLQTFDPLAKSYDSDFTHTDIGQWLRARLQTRLLIHWQSDHHVLELGCGTGEDALFLAQNGIHVTATDASEKMLDITRAKTQHTGLVNTASLDLQHLPDTPKHTFDGAFSNFGPLNVLDDWQPLAQWLAVRIPREGIVGLGIMSPFCVWEVVWHGLHLNPRTAMRRWRKNTTFQADGDTQPIRIRYPTIRRLTRDFEPYFRRVHVEAIGLFLPPSDVYGVIEKRPRMLRALKRLETHFARYSKLALLADHYWIEFERI